MHVRTVTQLFDHKCQLKDMKLSGFNPNSLRYHCTECGGVLVLKLDRQKWERAFGTNPSFKLSKKILQILEEVGAEPIMDEDELAEAQAQLPDPDKFHWAPSEADDEDDEEDED